MPRRPPSPPLFPYTTLFRSLNVHVPRDRAVDWTGVRLTAQHALASAAIPIVFPAEASACCAVDRKSTRLNSSHRTISYAVFCLKKKKKTKSGQHQHITCQPN